MNNDDYDPMDDIGLIHSVLRRLGLPPTEDNIQSGIVGLLEARRRYNPDLGAWSTYAYHWVRKEVQGNIPSFYPIPLTRHGCKLMKAMQNGNTVPEASRRALQVVAMGVASLDTDVGRTGTLGEFVIDPETDVEQIMIDKEIAEEIIGFVEKHCDDREKSVFQAIVVDGLTHTEASIALGMSRSDVQKVLNRVIRKVKDGCSGSC